ncbi:hypothetical protein LEP1GSC058_4125 [Leptospira fainei serovar Hurstbridge str. BUT 6]|uniref:Uncharacterized protein n=1 Tax=Leptospira fainei serovar Hurstbridge str. BUT 6 TaxID=1193011 RepID=S3UVR5_9LEPT|nr:hypothetical protein LEP1GSC058_4125 [Leptospira fainei serovar Hurstbridge str. BUT 6]
MELVTSEEFLTSAMNFKSYRFRIGLCNPVYAQSIAPAASGKEFLETPGGFFSMEKTSRPS